MDWQVQPDRRRDGARRVGTGTRETISMDGFILTLVRWFMATDLHARV
jgi:hypothetical protein